jgi:hypothetical protein
MTERKTVGERLQDYGRKHVVSRIKFWSRLDLKYKPFRILPADRCSVAEATLPKE